MKKSKILFVFVTAALSLGSLIGCNSSSEKSSQSRGELSSNPTISSDDAVHSRDNSSTNSSSGQTQSSKPGSSLTASSESGGGQATYTWSDADLALFNQYLHGCVLPHPGKDGVRVNVYPTNADVVVVSGCSFVRNELAEYAAKYSTADGWKGGDVSQALPTSIEAGSLYQFTKNVSTASGQRGVSVFFGCVEYGQDGNFHYAKEGELMLEATDPYSYSYTDLLNKLLSEIDFSANDLPPELSGVYAYSYEVAEDGNSVTINMYLNSSTSERDFSTLLRNNGWTVVSDDTGTTGITAYSPSDALQVNYHYDNANRCLIVIIAPYGKWNAQRIEQFFTKYNQEPQVIPALNIEGAKYQFKESDMNESYAANNRYDIVSATMSVTHSSVNETVFNNYIKTIQDAGWVAPVLDPEEHYAFGLKLLSDGKMYSFEITLDNTTLSIKIYAAGSPINDGRIAEYPRTQLAEFLDGLQDTIPTVNVRNSGYGFASKGDKKVVFGYYTDPEGAAEAINNYKTAFAKSNYTLKEGKDNTYISEHNELQVVLGQEEDVLEVIVYLEVTILNSTPDPTAWPSETIASAVISNLYGADFQDSVPVIDVASAESCSVNTNLSGKFHIYIDGFAANIAAVKQAFADNGWKTNIFDFDTTLLISPHGEMTAKIEATSDDITIEVGIYYPPTYAAWPAETINARLSEWSIQDILPEFDKALLVSPMMSDGSQKEFKIYVYTCSLSQTATNAAKERYDDALETANYYFTEGLNGYVSFYEELLVKTVVEKSEDDYYYLVIYVECLKAEPIYKIIGSFNDWNYENSEITFVNAPDEAYKSQLKAEFEVKAGDEFKIKDDATDNTGWFGAEILEPNDYFYGTDEGNIRAKRGGSVTLYFKLNYDSSRSIAILFTPGPVEWPQDALDDIIVDVWGIENIVPNFEDESLIGVELIEYNEEAKLIGLMVYNGLEVEEAYEDLLEDSFTYQDAGHWMAKNGTMELIVSEFGTDLIISIRFIKKGYDFESWSEVETQLVEFFDNDCEFFPYSAKTEAIYNIEFSSEEEEVKYADVTITVAEGAAETSMDQAIQAILQEFGVGTGSPLAYEYDAESGILSSPAENTPTYLFSLIDDSNFAIRVYFVEPEPETVNYILVCTDDWAFDNDPVFYAWVWGDNVEAQWIEMIYDEENACFHLNDVPAGATYVVIARMNPNAEVPSWGAAWNQTGDISLPNDGSTISFSFNS